MHLIPPTTTRLPGQQETVDSTTILVRTMPTAVDLAIPPREFRRVNGKWQSTTDDRTPGEFLRAAWHGLSKQQITRCMSAAGAVSECRSTLLVLGTSRRAVQLLAGSQTTGVLNMLLRTLAFD